MGSDNLTQISNPVFKAYLFYVAILMLKMLAMSLLTARQRFGKKAFSNQEDTKIAKNSKVNLNDPDVERVRRAHLNDIENIPVFAVAAWVYVLTNPAPFLAISLFRIFTLARFIHTFVYAIHVVPQPARALSFGVGFGITAYMLVHSIMHFM